jgi:hypothetical protein
LRIGRSVLHERANAAHFLALLRACRKRPRRRCAAEQRDELTALQLIKLHSFPASQGPFAGYRIARISQEATERFDDLLSYLQATLLPFTHIFTFCAASLIARADEVMNELPTGFSADPGR